MDLRKHAEEYFSTINPIASRIYNDINQTKAAYENLWNTLSPDEQEQVLNESIIKPDVQIKYQIQETTRREKQQYSVKMIIDDNNCSYRDEHSAPFSFKTKSQRDLTIFAVPKDRNVKNFTKTKTFKNAKKVDIPIVEKLDEPKLEKDLTNSTSSLPKTGLDFLDNW
ncbi:hypothetical protein WA026_003334 [Henosepilachna vigintioctopunctata]|uniref:DUF4706 domain-containing protein n=1 Tax=Henosepilachna vigintioctopunctata TaxID=420089 RepID=A0AAW1TNL0_9CUCU